MAESDFKFLKDATPVKCTFGVADEMVFPGRQTLNAYTGQGFPIGFDFKFGGRVFNQFAIDNNGYILFGYDKVEFRGYSNMFFLDSNIYADNYFYLGLRPMQYGIAAGDISYKTEGEAGDRTLTVEFSGMEINEPSRGTRGCAMYSLQLVMAEKDGSVTINFLEEETPYTTNQLVCGIRGWGPTDAQLLSSRGLNEDAVVAETGEANLTKGMGFLVWSQDDIFGDEEAGHMEPYCFSFKFTPTGEAGFVSDTPANLTMDQVNTTAVITCDRPANAPATAIMISEKPILEFPTQGLSYQVMNDKEEFTTVLDGATLIYYNDDEKPVAEFPNLKPSTLYYVKAFGVNGFPSYSYDTCAELEFISSHPAPYVMQTSSGAGSIGIKTIGDDDVVIAATLDRVNTSEEGMAGIFGKPDDGCKVGDKIDGGGEVIYVGAPGEFNYEKAAANREVFFRAWSLRDGRVSKTWLDAAGVTRPEYPYNPQLELYALYEIPLEWVGQTTNTSSTVAANFTPRTRGEDDEAVIGGVSVSACETSLTSPIIPFGEDATLRFEWAMETVREPEAVEGSIVVLPAGNKPGVFGQGHKFDVTLISRSGNVELYSADQYNGTMAENPTEEGRYIEGTSTFIPVEVELPATATSGKITFRFSTESHSILYMRKISVESKTGVVDLLTPDMSDIISAGEGSVTILSAKGGEYSIYTLDGVKAAAVSLGEGEGAAVALEKGVYVVNGHKVLVK